MYFFILVAHPKCQDTYKRTVEVSKLPGGQYLWIKLRWCQKTFHGRSRGQIWSCATLFICIKLNKYYKVSCSSACAGFTSAQWLIMVNYHPCTNYRESALRLYAALKRGEEKLFRPSTIKTDWKLGDVLWISCTGSPLNLLFYSWAWRLSEPKKPLWLHPLHQGCVTVCMEDCILVCLVFVGFLFLFFLK